MAVEGGQPMANYHQVVTNVVSTETKGEDDGPAFEAFKDLHLAIVKEDADKVGELSQTGLDMNQKFDDRINPQHAGITPLALACALNKSNIVEALLNNGADVNVPFAALNTTALMTSAFHGNSEVVRILLDHGADVSAVDLQKSTALGYAFGGQRNVDVVRMLIDAKIDVNLKNMLGMNALLLVAGYGNPELVAMILHAGADANASNDFGHTALHLAVVGKNDMVRNLRKQKGTDPSMERSLNRRNLDVAVQEWARLHVQNKQGTKEDQESLAAAGRIMMSIGHQLEDTPPEQGEDQDGLERRVRAVWKHRQMKLRNSREKRKSGGLWGLLSCGGGKSKATDDIPTSTRPGAAPTSPPSEQQKGVNPEEQQLNENFTHILRMLIDVGCAIDRPDRAFGMTALDLAILNGDVESSAVLAGAGAEPNHFLQMIALKEFYQAVTLHQTKEAKFLLDYDEDLDVNLAFTRFNVDSEGIDEGLTPLALAAREDNLEVARILLKRGAHVNDGGPAGRPPLTEAAAKGNKRMAELLLANAWVNIEVPSPAFQNATPLTVAVIFRQSEMVVFLIKKGAFVDKPQTDGSVALLHAYVMNDHQMVDQLLNAPLNVNYQDVEGLTAVLARDYQKKDRDTEAILSAIGAAAKEYEDIDPQDGHGAGPVPAPVQQQVVQQSPPRQGPPPQQSPPRQKSPQQSPVRQHSRSPPQSPREPPPSPPVKKDVTTVVMTSSPVRDASAPSSPEKSPVPREDQSDAKPTTDISQVVIKTQTVTFAGDGQTTTQTEKVTTVTSDGTTVQETERKAPIVQDDEEDEEEEESGSEEESESEEESGSEEESEDDAAEEYGLEQNGPTAVTTQHVTVTKTIRTVEVEGVEGDQQPDVIRTVKTVTQHVTHGEPVAANEDSTETSV